MPNILLLIDTQAEEAGVSLAPPQSCNMVHTANNTTATHNQANQQHWPSITQPTWQHVGEYMLTVYPQPTDMGCCVVAYALLGSHTVGELSLTAAMQITPCAATAAAAAAALRTVVACMCKHKCWAAAGGFALRPPWCWVEDPKHAACLCCTAITWPNCHVSCGHTHAGPDGWHGVHRQLAQA
jgi:hypothetical protein